jgi:hypothetical protein
MSTIDLTNNTTLTITGSSADGNSTIDRYLVDSLTFQIPAEFRAIASQQVSGVQPAAFPVTLTATGAGKFSVEGTSLNIKLGASASLNLQKEEDKDGVLESLKLPPGPKDEALVSLNLKGTLDATDNIKLSNFGLGFGVGSAVGLTSSYRASAAETLAEAVRKAVAAITIPHDLDDLKNIPDKSICQVNGQSSLKFTASVSYSILNNPLATVSVPAGLSISVNAKAGATLEATVTHQSGHTLTIAKVSDAILHLAVGLNRTDDFATSLTVSAGLTVQAGSDDALAFLLGKISALPKDEIDRIKADIPPGQAKQIAGDIKKAIDASMSSALQISLKAALDDSQSKDHIFVYEIDLNNLDASAREALVSALDGDFTAITKPGAAFAGIRVLDSALTTTSKVQHSLVFHLLGIFNWADINTFVKKVKVDYTSGASEIVLSDESIELVTSSIPSGSLHPDKLREVVLKATTLTLSASANTPTANARINTVFFDRQADVSDSVMRQFFNVLADVGAQGDAQKAQSLLAHGKSHYGAASLCLDMNLDPLQCSLLFVENGQPRNWNYYVDIVSAAQRIILANDPDNADRLKLYSRSLAFWEDLRDAGAAPNQQRLLAQKGIRPNAIVDVITVIWWATAMADYAEALNNHGPLAKFGESVVKDSTNGFGEPWFVLSVWTILGEPKMNVLFTVS